MTQDNVLPADLSTGLADAIILASDAPSLLLNGDLTVLTASNSFCRSFGIDPSQATGAPLASLGSGEWDVPQLISLLMVTASGLAAVEGYEMDLRRSGKDVRHLLVSARRLALADGARTLVLLSCVDATEARHRERRTNALVQEKAVLLNELNHRVANSLQIIASLLLQSARTVQSEEARTHISAAHHRLMSVAEMQKQLALSDRETVPLAEYFASLCRSIGASMIRDRSRLAIEVSVDDSVVAPNVSLSLGLIVTELVINALKHAFPDGQRGRIAVAFTSTGEGWRLSVQDDGVGMPEHEAKAGLGSNIVKALVMQLDARIETASANPGTLVTVVRDEAAVASTRPTLAAV